MIVRQSYKLPALNINDEQSNYIESNNNLHKMIL